MESIESSNSNRKKNTVDVYDAIVIGGGCAGVEATRKLYANGVKNILLLEAQDRLGGRIRTIYLHGNKNMPIEYGANWIHGIADNVLYNVVKENETRFYHEKEDLFCDDNVYCADEDGNKYSSELCDEMYDLYRKFNQDSKLFWEQNINCPFKNYAEYIWYRYEEYMKHDDEAAKKLKRAMVRRILKCETIEFSCSSMKQCTIKAFGSYKRPIGPDFEFPGGYSTFISYLTEELPRELIKTSHPVKSITLAPTVDTDTPRDLVKLQVECYNDVRFECRHVIVTCSLNYLKKNHRTLFPSGLFPEKKINTINRMSMGLVDKIFMVFDDMSFWPEDTNSVHPLFFNDDEYDIKTRWYYKVFTFDKFYDNVLLVWLSGDEADYVETLPDSEVSRELTGLLKRLLKKDDVPEPTELIRTNWNSNPYVLGSYSYINGHSNSTDNIKYLSEPIYIKSVPRILFAGEATHADYYTTVHGAYLSGQREAARLLRQFNVSEKEPMHKL